MMYSLTLNMTAYLPAIIEKYHLTGADFAHNLMTPEGNLDFLVDVTAAKMKSDVQILFAIAMGKGIFLECHSWCWIFCSSDEPQKLHFIEQIFRAVLYQTQETI